MTCSIVGYYSSNIISSYRLNLDECAYFIIAQCCDLIINDIVRNGKHNCGLLTLRN